MPSSLSLEAELGLEAADGGGGLDLEYEDRAGSANSRGSSLEKSSTHSSSGGTSSNGLHQQPQTQPPGGISDRVEEELSRLWDSGQEWILIFDNLLKHPGGKVSKGCKCDMCEMQKQHQQPLSAVEQQQKSIVSKNVPLIGLFWTV